MWVALVVLGAGGAQAAGPSHAAVSRAARWVGLQSLRPVSRTGNDDCSGLVRLAYHTQPVALEPRVPVPGEGGVQGMYRRARALGALTRTPQRGDLVFFRDTYDRNRDGRRNDGLTHVGIVEHVAADGTVTFIHRFKRGVERSRLNLAFPTVQRDARGRVLNDFLRRPDRITTRRLAGELFAGFATVDARWQQEAEVQRASARRVPRRR